MNLIVSSSGLLKQLSKISGVIPSRSVLPIIENFLFDITEGKLTISTTNFQSFSELAFSFALTPRIAIASIGFALAMGLVGGFLPAVKASRMRIVDALRAD